VLEGIVVAGLSAAFSLYGLGIIILSHGDIIAQMFYRGSRGEWRGGIIFG
jgi:hypothetical protein